MLTNRRDMFRSALVAGLTAGMPSMAGATPTSGSDPKARYAKLDAAASLPVFKRELFPEPAIIQTIELLHYNRSWLCRVRTKDGAEGISVSNSQKMEVLYPIFAKRIAPYFIGKDARDLEALLEEVTVYESNYKATGLAIFVPMATLEFAILDMFRKMVNRPIGLLISDKIYNPKINVYEANGERYISAEQAIEHIHPPLPGQREHGHFVGGDGSHKANRCHPWDNTPCLAPVRDPTMVQRLAWPPRLKTHVGRAPPHVARPGEPPEPRRASHSAA